MRPEKANVVSDLSERLTKSPFVLVTDYQRMNVNHFADLRTRARWEDYMRTYEVAIHETAADAEPGADVSADEKWFTRLVVAAVVVHALQRRGAHGATDGWTRTGT